MVNFYSFTLFFQKFFQGIIHLVETQDKPPRRILHQAGINSAGKKSNYVSCLQTPEDLDNLNIEK